MADPKTKIVIVEDNDLNLKLFKDILEAHGYDTVDTRDGAEAYELVKAETPNLVIMDIQLPNVSGIDIIKQLKNDDDTKHIPVIAVTAFAMQDDKQHILASGCEDYVAKPISIAPFIETINKHLGK